MFRGSKTPLLPSASVFSERLGEEPQAWPGVAFRASFSAQAVQVEPQGAAVCFVVARAPQIPAQR